MDTNVRGAFLLCGRALPGMVRRRRGAIVNLASVASFVGFERDAAYCASKGALLMLTRQLALEYAPHGVRVNAICPGFVDTPELRHYVSSSRTRALRSRPVWRSIRSAASAGRRRSPLPPCSWPATSPRS
jgi:NAD(P)-dependent dehydrogenase (short-subunit alcohol dehydrogenase family)